MNDQHNNCGTTRINPCCGAARTECGCAAEKAARTVCGCNNGWRTYSRSGGSCSCNNSWRTYPRMGGNCGCNNNWRTYPRTAPACSNHSAETREGCGCNRNTIRTATETTWKSGNCGQRCPSPLCHNCAQGASADSCLSGRSLAMVYSPHQNFENLYDSREGLCNGTVFCDLNKPFLASGR